MSIKKRGNLTKDKKCPECEKLIQRRSKMCNSCSRLGERHPRWKGGLPKCIDCGKQLKGFYAKRCLSCAGKEKIFTKKHRYNLSLASKNKPKLWLMGENNPSWKGGITPEKHKIRQSNKYKEWAQYIKERDDYECQICGRKGIFLHSNHIKRFADYPELRLIKNNGITICRDCDNRLVKQHEKEWESYFNFNLETRGFK